MRKKLATARGSHERLSTSWAKALAAAATGFVLSALISLIIVLGIQFGVWPFPTLERAGADASMRVFVDQAERLDHPPSGQPFVFVDIDRDACLAFTTDVASCDVDRPTPTKLILAFTTAVKASGASAVMVDVAPPSDAVEAKSLDDAMDGPDGPWFITPFVARPIEGEDGFRLTGRFRAVSDMAGSRHVRAVFATFVDPSIGDGVVRSYPLAVSGRDAETAEEIVLPSAPWLAAKLAATKWPANAVLRSAEAAADRRSSFSQIFYTLPSLTTRSPSGSACVERNPMTYIGRYERYCASHLLDAGPARFRLDPTLFRGRIVVLGKASASGRDRYPTPIGTLSGAEIIINATRTLTDFPRQAPMHLEPEGHSFQVGRLLREWVLRLQGGLVGALLIFPAWFLVFGIVKRTAWSPSRKRVTAFAIILAGILLAAYVELVGLSKELGHAFETGRAVDVLIPILALGLESYADVAHHVTEAIRHRVERALASLEKLVERVKRKSV